MDGCYLVSMCLCSEILVSTYQTARCYIVEDPTKKSISDFNHGPKAEWLKLGCSFFVPAITIVWNEPISLPSYIIGDVEIWPSHELEARQWILLILLRASHTEISVPALVTPTPDSHRNASQIAVVRCALSREELSTFPVLVPPSYNFSSTLYH
jgi:hypothetical protein